MRQKAELMVMGVDPGFSKIGVSIVKRENGILKLVHLEVIETEKGGKKQKNNLRVTNDDVRRYQEITVALDRIREEFHPFGLGVEAYRVALGFGGKGNLASTGKCASVYGGVVFWAKTNGLVCYPFLPNDLKTRFGGCKTASKEDVEAGICREVKGFSEAVRNIAKSKREHVADATGHAVLMLEEIDNIRQLVGL